MRKYLFIIIPLLSSCNNLCPDRQIGMATHLSGEVHVITYFVNDGQTAFSRKTKDRYLQMLEIGEEWLIKQARNRGVYLHFDNNINQTYFETYELTACTDWNNFDPTQFYCCMYGDYNKAVKQISSYGENTIVIIFTPLNNTKSFCKVSHDANRPIETAVMYKTWNFEYKERKGLEIAHEILHAYGASDLYKPERFQLGYEKYYHLFDQSIMKKLAYSGNEICVDDMTAYAVGWSSDKKEWYALYNVQ